MRAAWLAAMAAWSLLSAAWGASTVAPVQKVAPELAARVQASAPVDVVVELDDAEVRGQADALRRSRGLLYDDSFVLAFKADRYRGLKQHLVNDTLPHGLTVRRDYSHLPMLAVRVNGAADLDALVRDDRVVAVYDDERLRLHLAESLPLIRQPQALTLDESGAGTAVAILDTGVDYTRTAFGPCTAPGVPAGCKVIFAQDFAPDDGALDDNGHGTNVAGIVAGVAPGTRIAALDVFDGTSASTSTVIAAINWTIANQAAYNIVAINMSLGAGLFTSPCQSGNAFRTPIINARSAGILTVASSGNDGATNALANPACTPEAVSVGAVYDSNVGPVSYSVCSDATTAADRVTCFSNSAGFLSLLAPGAFITAAGSTYAGTSQAAPHVSGAVAILRAAYPAETLSATLSRLTARGVSVTDPRNGLVKPRIDMLAALGAANDAFSAAVVLTGSQGSVYGYNGDATKEAGEPDHAGDSGGKSVWWQWTAPQSGVVNFTTAGSDFNTLLAVYTGTSPATLSPVTDAADGTTSSVTFDAVAGTTYRIAVDGAHAASGTVVFGWSYIVAGYVDQDIPLLPPWALVTLTGVLLAGGWWRGGRRSR